MKNRRGGQAVEFALILPILLMVFSGIIDYSWYFHNQNILTQAIRSASRGASVLDSQESELTPCNFATEEVNSNLNDMGISNQGRSISSQIISGSESRLEVLIDQPYQPLFGLTLVPQSILVKTVVRLEDQNWEGC
jgi:Flp pilus assembly protein TadG